MSDNRTIQQLEELARKINPDFVIQEDWKRRVRNIKEYNNFFTIAYNVLQAELDHGFYSKAHHKRTLEEKNQLSHQLSCLLAELLGQIYTARLPLEGHSDFLGDFSADQVKKISHEIAEKGYSIWPELIPQDLVDNLLNELKNKTYKNKVTGKEISGDQAIESEDEYAGVWWVKNAYELPATEFLQKISLDHAFLAIAQDYLGTIPIHVQTNSWFSFPLPASANTRKRIARLENKNAQRFHQDQEFVTFLKAFIYLSDVNENNGPHVYVEGSANDYEQKLLTKVSSDRLTDDEIYEAFGKERVKRITGSKGQLVFVNTRGYHRGSSVLEGHRLLLQIEYASSLYFNPVIPFDKTKLSRENKILEQKLPRIFMNYRELDKIKQVSSDGCLQQVQQKLSYLRGRIEEMIA